MALKTNMVGRTIENVSTGITTFSSQAPHWGESVMEIPNAEEKGYLLPPPVTFLYWRRREISFRWLVGRPCYSFPFASAGSKLKHERIFLCSIFYESDGSYIYFGEKIHGPGRAGMREADSSTRPVLVSVKRWKSQKPLPFKSNLSLKG
jgi:hypothetical protein